MRTVCLILCFAGSLFAQGDAPPKAPTDVKPGSIAYEDIAYPYPVSYLPLVLYGQDVRMAYMDVPPSGQPNGRTVMLFHGMNFGGFYFAGPIEALRKEGFRVVVPDQIGFGRSSKPIIPYNFHDMALNSRTLLESLGIAKVSIVGHSMGGMLAARFAASFPDITERAVIYDPIGLTDIRYERPWRSADEAYKATMAQTNDQRWQAFYANIRRYFPSPGAWKPEYEQYVRILYAPTLSARMAAAGDGAVHLPADAVSGPGGVRLGEDQGEDAGDRRGEGRDGFSAAGQARRGHHTGGGTGNSAESGTRSASGGAGRVLSAAAEVPEVSEKPTYSFCKRTTSSVSSMRTDRDPALSFGQTIRKGPWFPESAFPSRLSATMMDSLPKPSSSSPSENTTW